MNIKIIKKYKDYNVFIDFIFFIYDNNIIYYFYISGVIIVNFLIISYL